MKRAVLTQIAWTHLTARVRQTVVASLGVTFGISMYIFMNSLVSGVNDLQTDLAFSTTAHVRMFSGEPRPRQSLVRQWFGPQAVVRLTHEQAQPTPDYIANPDQWLTILQRDPMVQAVTRQVNANVFFRNGPTQANGTISGVDILAEDALFDVRSTMRQGDLESIRQQPNALLLGSQLARKLGVRLHDYVSIMTSEGVIRPYEVTGIFETSVAAIDKTKAYASIPAVQQLLGKNRSYITEIKINLHDYQQAPAFARRYAHRSGYSVEDWKTANQQMQAASFLRDIISASVVFTILLVAGFGIYNILNMTIYEKIKDIAILKAMGFSGRDVTLIFLQQALFIGLLGGLAGLALGWGISALVDQVPLRMANVDTLPVNFRLKDYVAAFSFGLITTTLAGYLPARKASQVDPVTIIRG
ncbi:ABC transporter permease [Larkinella sp. VNQ87]|uniref:ABC transporter permease n=1 Tax=Larkinella sp. VNQ87 TaxID=3400921 RepID=UPI003C0A62C1